MDRRDLHFCFCSISGGWLRYSQISQQEVDNDLVIFAKIVYFLLGNLWLSPDILWKLKCRSDLSITKYISAILFCGQMALVLPHAWKYLFLIDNHFKRLNIFSDLPKITSIFWTLLRLNLLQWGQSEFFHWNILKEVIPNCFKIALVCANIQLSKSFDVTITNLELEINRKTDKNDRAETSNSN